MWEKIKNGEITLEKNERDEFVMLDYNVINPFSSVFLKYEDGDVRHDHETSKYWKEKLKGIHTIKRITICDTVNLANYSTTYPELKPSPSFKFTLKDFQSTSYMRMLEQSNKNRAYFRWEYKFPQLIRANMRGVVDFNDYPNQKITAFQALDIDCDLLFTYNIHIKDLDPQSFQFITLEYSDEGNTGKIEFEGQINRDLLLKKSKKKSKKKSD